MWSRYLGKESESVPKERGHIWFSAESCAVYQVLTPAGLSHSCVSGGRKGAKEFACEVTVAQSCPILCDPMDCSPLGSSLHGTVQARILEWVAMLSSRGIFPTQGLNPGLPHCRQILYQLSHQGRVYIILYKSPPPFLNFFNWKIVELQCCANFCCAMKWLSLHTYTLF